MKLSFRRSKKAPAGFVISLEFLLVMALVVIPLMIGMILLARKAVTLYLNYMAAVEQPLSRPVVWDSSAPAKPVGPVIGYDQFDTPQVLYRDASAGIVVGGTAVSPGVLLGVRQNRFTTVSRVYYSGANCTGTAHVRTAASGSPEVGFLSQTQGLNYAVGNGNVLYREAAGAPVLPFLSSWASQDNRDAGPESAPSTACSNTEVPAFLATQSGGITARASLDVSSNFVVVNTSQAATQPGVITTIHYYAQATGTIAFLLVNAANQVQWVSPGIPVVSTGVHTFTPTPSVGVHAGWKLGYYAQGSPPGGVIPYDAGGPGFAASTANNSGLPVMGQTLAVGAAVNRTYSFGVFPSGFDVWVTATTVAALGSSSGPFTGNFTPPFRTAFPYAAPGPPLPPSTGG